MSSTESLAARVFEHGMDIPAAVVPAVWQAWCTLSEWQDWDASLRGVEAEANGLSLGKRFAVVTKAAPAPVIVHVTAFEDHRHFTTSSAGPLGLLSFGHTVAPGLQPHLARVTHSICALPGDGGLLPDAVWARLRSDVVESVIALVNRAAAAAQEVTA
jgi:hypothetical protein